MDACTRCREPTEIHKEWRTQFANGWTPGISLGDTLCESCYLEMAITYDEERLLRIGASLFRFIDKFNDLAKYFRCCQSIQTFRMLYATLLNAVDTDGGRKGNRNTRLKMAAIEFLKIRSKVVQRLDQHDCEASEYLLSYLSKLENNFPRI